MRTTPESIGARHPLRSAFAATALRNPQRRQRRRRHPEKTQPSGRVAIGADLHNSTAGHFFPGVDRASVKVPGCERSRAATSALAASALDARNRQTSGDVSRHRDPGALLYRQVPASRHVKRELFRPAGHVAFVRSKINTPSGEVAGFDRDRASERPYPENCAWPGGE